VYVNKTIVLMHVFDIAHVHTLSDTHTHTYTHTHTHTPRAYN